MVAVVKGQELWVANAGDSRAVLCRGGQALALSEDHKPQSETERNRITAAGGFVSDVGGVSRWGSPCLSALRGGLWAASGNEMRGQSRTVIRAEENISDHLIHSSSYRGRAELMLVAMLAAMLGSAQGR